MSRDRSFPAFLWSAGRGVFTRLRRALGLMLGVTLISFLLVVELGPDLTYKHVGKNPTAEEIAAVRHSLGYDRPWWQRYGDFVGRMLRGDLGRSDDSGERISQILKRSLPVSLALLLPGFVLGHLLGLGLAMLAAWRYQGWSDSGLNLFAVIGMSLSFPAVMLLVQWGLSSRQGLNLFPVQGWAMESLVQYLRYVSVPSLALLVVTVGYNLRFYRALLVEELNQEYVLTARAYGAGGAQILVHHVLWNILNPVLTRILYSLPGLLVGGSLLLEKHFNIPGIGVLSYNAVVNGDQSMVLVLVTLSALLFVLLNESIDGVYRWIDPRLARDVET